MTFDDTALPPEDDPYEVPLSLGGDEPATPLRSDDTFDENPLVDQDEYAAEWASLVPDEPTDPREYLADLVLLVERILTDKGSTDFDDGDAELEADLESAREVKAAIDDGEDVHAADAQAAVDSIGRVFESLLPGVARSTMATGSIDPLAADEIADDEQAGDIGEDMDR
jgi:hypothetical protein